MNFLIRLGILFLLFLATDSCNLKESKKITNIDTYREMRKEKLNQPRVIHNNDGCDAYLFPADQEFSISNFLDYRSSGLKGTDVSTISYCTIASSFGQFTHNTKVGEFLTLQHNRPGKKNITPEFVKHNTDPLEVTSKFANENGFDFFWSNRINDCHDSGHRKDKPYERYSKLKTKHPEYLFGSIGEKLPHGRWSAVDFSHQEIRDLCVQYYTEVCENYDVDGIELDFFRSLGLIFQNVARGELATQEQLDMLTDMLSQIRKMTERVGMEKGKPILVLVRLPDGIEYCRGMGVDLQSWMSKNLVDIVVGTGLFRLNPWKYLVELGHKYGVKVYAGLSEPRIKNEHPFLIRKQNAVYRARSAAAWQAGVDGLYIFNEYNTRSQYLSEIGSANKLKNKNNLYFATYLNWNPESQIGSITGGKDYLNLPILTPSNSVSLNDKPFKLSLEIGDESNQAKIALILYSKGGNSKNITVTLNGVQLELNKTTNEGLAVFEILPEFVKPGENDLELSYVPSQNSLTLLDLAILFYRINDDPDTKELASMCFNN